MDAGDDKRRFSFSLGDLSIVIIWKVAGDLVAVDALGRHGGVGIRVRSVGYSSWNRSQRCGVRSKGLRDRQIMIRLLRVYEVYLRFRTGQCGVILDGVVLGRLEVRRVSKFGKAFSLKSEQAN